MFRTKSMCVRAHSTLPIASYSRTAQKRRMGARAFDLAVGKLRFVMLSGLFLATASACRSDELVVTQIEACHDVTEFSGVLICKCLGRHTAVAGGLLHLLAMLIGSSQKEHIPAEQSLKACPDITNGCCVDVTNVRAVVDVVNRCGDVSGVGGHGRAW